MSGDIAVHVAVGERNLLAGRLYPHRRRGIESASFVYDDRYLADPDAYALDPALPLVTGTLQTPVGRALFGAFSDCAPDRWGRTHASVDTLMGTAGDFRLNLRQASDVLAQVARAVGRWRAVAASHGLQQADIDAMEPAFDHDERGRAQALAENRRG